MDIESRIGELTRLKGVLCWRGDVLAEKVIEILAELGVPVEVDEKCIEDGRLVRTDGELYGVIEIKGVNGSIKRAMIAQVDGHRERQGLPPTAPGILIVNTRANAELLEGKEEDIHPDIVTKAVSDNVLLVRTIDLLRIYAHVMSGKLARQELHHHLDTSSGWLKATPSGIELVGPC